MTFRIVHIGAGEWSIYAHGQPDQHLLARGCRQPPNHAPETQNHVLNNPMLISGCASYEKRRAAAFGSNWGQSAAHSEAGAVTSGRNQ
jgi:hypothetical protein